MSPKKSSAGGGQLLLIGALILCLATLAVHAGIQLALTARLTRKLAQATQAERDRREQAKKESETKFQAALADAEASVQEGRAGQARAQEFQRRQALDPALANSPDEKRLLEMQKLGQDDSLEPATRLQKLAKLAAPKGSGVRVTAEKKKSYSIEVAIPMKAIQAQVETRGGRMDTRDLHREMRRVVAGVMRDLFAFGASSGLQAVEVSCQQIVEVRSGGTGDKSQEYRELYRAKWAPHAPANYNWLALSRTEVIPMMTTTKDEFARMVDRK